MEFSCPNVMSAKWKHNLTLSGMGAPKGAIKVSENYIKFKPLIKAHLVS